MMEEEEAEEQPAVTFFYSPERDPALRRRENDEHWLGLRPMLS